MRSIDLYSYGMLEGYFQIEAVHEASSPAKQKTQFWRPVAPPEEATWVERTWNTHWTHKNLLLVEEEGRKVVRSEAFRLITTRNLVMNREIPEVLDGFDEELPTGEDTDFVFRALRADQKCYKIDRHPSKVVLIDVTP